MPVSFHMPSLQYPITISSPELQFWTLVSPSMHSASLHSVNLASWHVPSTHDDSPHKGSVQSSSVSQVKSSFKHIGVKGQLSASLPENKTLPSHARASCCAHIAQSVAHVVISSFSQRLFPQIIPLTSTTSSFAWQMLAMQCKSLFCSVAIPFSSVIIIALFPQTFPVH